MSQINAFPIATRTVDFQKVIDAEAQSAEALPKLADFNAVYLGEKTSDPGTDNDGGALQAGALYFNTSADEMRVYSGSAWIALNAVLPQGLDTTDSPEFAGLTVDTDTLYVDSSNNRVGIGTSSPDEPLVVAGNQKIIDAVEGGSVDLKLINSYAPTDFNHFDETVEIKAFLAHGDGVQDESGKIVFGKDNNYGGGGASSKDSNLQFYTEENGALSEAMRIDSSGNVGIGTSSPSEALEVSGTIAGTSVTATEGTFSRLNVGANLEWNASTDTYTANTTPTTVTKVHQGMKRCVLNDDGSVNYYLDPTDSTKKLDGTTANIDGTDGNVMVEIPKFYFRQVRDGSTLGWQVSDVPLAGYQLHPAFFKNGEIVDFRYIGAYDACVYDDSAGTYIAGLNLDDNTGNIDTANDKLASVSGVYPMVGVTRDGCRSLAANNGTGWRQQDFWLTCAVQMLYLVEYGDFNSQSNLGDGNTNGGYIDSSADQNDSPHTVAGASNSFGNAATDGSQPSAGAKPGTAYMSYRGIENFFGNCWNWVDGFNIGVVDDRDSWVSNTDTDFADNTNTNYEKIGGTMPATNNYVTDIQDIPGAFLPSTVGGSSSAFLTDYFLQNAGVRVARLGGGATDGALAGTFFWDVRGSSSDASRRVGARLCY